jgi:hypothetical protein
VRERLHDDLTSDQRIVMAAHVAYTFKLDPVAVLEEPDRRKSLVRQAAHLIIQQAKTPPPDEH